MTNLVVGDYAIGKREIGDKKFLFKVTGFDKSVVQGVLEKDSHVTSLRKNVEVPSKDIVLSLGKNPFPGHAYGCDIQQLYKGKKTHPDFGSLYWFYKPEQEVGDRIVKAFDKAYKTIKHHRLEFAVQPDICIWEIMPKNKDKYAGMYRRSSNPEKSPHRFLIKPEILEAQQFQYVVLHEFAHHLHSEHMTSKKLNGEWLRAYNSSILVENIKREKTNEILDNMLGQESVPSDFKGQLDEEDANAFKWVLKAIKQQHKLSIKELDLLFEAEFFDDIRAVWPVRGVSSSDLAPIVSDYATKNVRELFADSVSFHMLEIKIPKAIAALVEKSFSYARANHDKQ